MPKKTATLILTIFGLFLISLLNQPSFAFPKISATSAAVVEVQSAQLIYDKLAYKERAPASLTKMLTAILIVQYGNLDQTVIVSKHASQTLPVKLNLKPGEEISLNNLLLASLMRSSNDSCVAMAEHVAGSEAYFIHLMNLKAWALGLQHSHFNNPNGLPINNHYSCAADLAKIGIRALRLTSINKYVSQKKASILRNNRNITLYNTNRLLTYYPGANGIKTGTTNAAGKCLAASVDYNNKAFIAIVLNANDRYKDSTVLLDYAQKNFETKKVMEVNQNISFTPKMSNICYTIVNAIYFPFKNQQTYKTYFLPLKNPLNIGEPFKQVTGVLVTDESVLWYDIYAKKVGH